MLQLRQIIKLQKTTIVCWPKYCTKPNLELNTYAKKKNAYGDLYPDKLLSKKIKTPDILYLANEVSADSIMNLLRPYLNSAQCDIAFLLNPGLGQLAQRFIDKSEKPFRKIMLIESMEHFEPNLLELQLLHPERVQVKAGDIVHIWKQAYQDKMDNGTRIDKLLEDVPCRPHDDDPNIILFGAVGCYNFFKYLINSLVFQTGLMAMGRTEMYFVMPPHIYIHLTCSKDIGYMIYRSTSMLFQMLFEHRFIAKVPRNHFLPTQSDYSATKGSKLDIVTSIDTTSLYLVKIVPRRNIFDLCPAADLPALWYFTKQNCISRRNRVIPNLEKWIPGCGPRLIINQQKPASSHVLFPEEDLEKLPKYSKPCVTMSCRDFYPNMNIYTQFGDLSVSQMLTLFTQFRNWREYGESSFLASLENSLIKMEAVADENIVDENIVEEDDIVSNITELPEVEVSTKSSLQENKKLTPKRKRKEKSTKSK